MVSLKKRKYSSIRRYPIVGGRRVSNYWWSLVIFLGGCGFLLTGISSYFNTNLWVLPSGLEHFVQSLDNSVAFLSTSLIGSGMKKLNEFTKVVNVFPNMKFSDFFIGFSENKTLNDTLLNSNTKINLPFFPQGLVLSFYGFLGLSFSFHLWFTLYWKIGGGFNEFNGKDRYVRLFRWGRPGKNRRIDLKYTNELIEAIKVELIPRPALFLRVKGDKNIPLTRIGDFIPLEELEAQAAELTSFMQIPLEMES